MKRFLTILMVLSIVGCSSNVAHDLHFTESYKRCELNGGFWFIENPRIIIVDTSKGEKRQYAGTAVCKNGAEFKLQIVE